MVDDTGLSFHLDFLSFCFAWTHGMDIEKEMFCSFHDGNLCLGLDGGVLLRSSGCAGLCYVCGT